MRNATPEQLKNFSSTKTFQKHVNHFLISTVTVERLCYSNNYLLAAYFLLIFFFFFFFQFLHLDQSNPPENVKAQITKNETLSSVSETAQALLTRLLVSSATYLIRHD